MPFLSPQAAPEPPVPRGTSRQPPRATAAAILSPGSAARAPASKMAARASAGASGRAEAAVLVTAEPPRPGPGWSRRRGL